MWIDGEPVATYVFSDPRPTWDYGFSCMTHAQERNCGIRGRESRAVRAAKKSKRALQNKSRKANRR